MLQSGIPQYLFALGAVLLLVLICHPFAHVLGYQTVALILLLAVTLLPLVLGLGPVLLAAVLSVLAWDFFFIPPRFTLVVGETHDILMLFMYCAVAAVTGILTTRVRARQKAIEQREERTAALYALTNELSRANNQDEVAQAAISNIKDHFSTDVVMFLSKADGDILPIPHSASTFTLEPKEFSVASWVYWNEKKAGKSTDTLSSAEATYFPISGPRYALGVIGIKASDGRHLSLDMEVLLQNFIRQIAAALEREQLNEITKKSIAIAESERLYKTLFDSLSHELRTPIATIVSASEAQLDREIDRTSPQGYLTGEIHTAATRLNRLVENLLDMTRLETGRIQAKRDWCDVHDLVNTVLRKLSDEIASHILRVEIPETMPFVIMDFSLMDQALTNLLHNAALYSPAGSEIVVHACVSNSKCVLEVLDSGPGIPEECLPNIFEKFFRVPGTRAGGTGLGLSIVKGFVEAQGGTVVARNRPEGGAQFIIMLPLPEKQPELTGGVP